jgi:nucleoid-associated protein YgaU
MSTRLGRCPTRRGLLVVGGLVVGYAAVTALLLWGSAGAAATVGAPGPATADAYVVVAAAAGAWLLLTWLVGVALVSVVAAALAGVGSRTHEVAIALTPVAARRTVAALVGLALAGAPLAAAAPAGAAGPAPVVVSAPATGSNDQPARAIDALDPLDALALDALDRPAARAAALPRGWTPDRPAGTRRSGPAAAAAVRLVASTPHAEQAVADEVVVRRGDSLWDIAARHLGRGASTAEVAAEWPRWYAANRAVVGDDPDLLLPGQRLVAPQS